MKLILKITILLCIPFQVFSHSGGTDKYGCHAGSKPYHCHNDNDNDNDNDTGNAEPVSLTAWDLNIGYQYHIRKSVFTPFIGVSIGASKLDEDTILGHNIGLRLQNQFYFGFVSTSKSIQVGYQVIHLSVNQDYFGIGLNIPFGGYMTKSRSSIYVSGSVFMGNEE